MHTGNECPCSTSAVLLGLGYMAAPHHWGAMYARDEGRLLGVWAWSLEATCTGLAWLSWTVAAWRGVLGGQSEGVQSCGL